MDVVETCLKGTLSSGEPSTKRSITSIYDDDEVVGFLRDAEIIMMKLMRGTKERDVISIFGMPGLGKTTLASKVYNNLSIVIYFDVKAWCAISQAYNRRTILVEIFKQATNDKIKIKEDDDVADMLRRVLLGKRYLIVLDDIWDVEAWEDLGICFLEGEDRSRSEESWELLEKKVFRGESCPPDLLEAGLQVTLHCKGLPLVVVLIAGIIAKMEREASLWLEVANDFSSFALGEQSMKVIQSSYDHLEDHLNPCLLYMALFPEDHNILLVDGLLKLWMAEEFVLNAGTENMEEACRVCLSDLLNRNLIMVSGMRINRDVEYCSLHDVVREFCLRKLTERQICSGIAFDGCGIANFMVDIAPTLSPKSTGEYNDQESSTTMLENLKTFRTCYISRYDINPRFWWKFSKLEELSLRIKYAPKFPLFPISEVHTCLNSLFLEFTLKEFWDSVGWESYFVFPSNLWFQTLQDCGNLRVSN
ncbi:hypothetical protein KY285_027554 [Solanum tuberosum]|nr:hypothetical protein KY289_027753 [Solanum tuberosum]KAH0666348.1 hypothetical protein KY285_027554 [Solanum tuberosum]